MPHTLLSMSQRVASQAGYSGTITSVAVAQGDAARIVDFVRDASAYVQALWGDWRFLWGGLQEGVTSDTTVTIPAPGDHYRWDQDRLFFNYRTVCPIMYHEFQPYAHMDDAAYPTQFVIMPDSSIRMYPPPDDAYAYSFSWYREAPELVEDSDEPLVPNRFRNTIIAYALWLYAMYDDAAELAAKSDAEYAKYLLLLEADQRPDGFPTNQSSGNHFRVSAE